jgi:carbon-monoxide dehydrogenase small subunit
MAPTFPLRGPNPPASHGATPSRELVRLKVNGHEREVAVRPYDVLLDTVRDELNLTGTTRGCDMGTCGCCTVLIDGTPTLSCLTLTLLAEDRDVRTIESVAPLGTDLHPVQRAFHQKGGSQCGYCTPGFIMTTVGFLDENPNPTDAEIRRAISGNMCRCTGYLKIIESVKTAAAEMSGAKVSGGNVSGGSASGGNVSGRQSGPSGNGGTR